MAPVSGMVLGNLGDYKRCLLASEEPLEPFRVYQGQHVQISAWVDVDVSVIRLWHNLVERQQNCISVSDASGRSVLSRRLLDGSIRKTNEISILSKVLLKVSRCGEDVEVVHYENEPSSSDDCINSNRFILVLKTYFTPAVSHRVYRDVLHLRWLVEGLEASLVELLPSARLVVLSPLELKAEWRSASYVASPRALLVMCNVTEDWNIDVLEILVEPPPGEGLQQVERITLRAGEVFCKALAASEELLFSNVFVHWRCEGFEEPGMVVNSWTGCCMSRQHVVQSGIARHSFVARAPERVLCMQPFTLNVDIRSLSGPLEGDISVSLLTLETTPSLPSVTASSSQRSSRNKNRRILDATPTLAPPIMVTQTTKTLPQNREKDNRHSQTSFTLIATRVGFLALPRVKFAGAEHRSGSILVE